MVVNPRILIAHRFALVREAATQVLGSRFRASAAGTSFEEVEAILRTEEFEVILLGLTWSGKWSGVPVVSRIARAQPEARLVVVAGHNDWHLCQAAIEAGARGFLVEESPMPELLSGVTTVLDGLLYVTPMLLQAQAHESRDGLTSKNLAILQLLAEDRTCKQVAAALGMNARAVRHHMSEIRRKHGVPPNEQSPWRRLWTTTQNRVA